MSEKKPQIDMTPCKSTAVRAFGYDPATKTLAVAFNGGKTYRYEGVPPAIAAGLPEAKSIGKYLARNVTSKFKPAKD